MDEKISSMIIDQNSDTDDDDNNIDKNYNNVFSDYDNGNNVNDDDITQIETIITRDTKERKKEREGEKRCRVECLSAVPRRANRSRLKRQSDRSSSYPALTLKDDLEGRRS